MQTKVAIGKRSVEHVCVLWWMDLTTCDVSASPGAFICQIHAHEIICFVDNGPDVYVRCGRRSRQLCVKIQ